MTENTPTRTILVAHNGGLFGAERSLLSLAQGLHHSAAFEPLVLVPHEGSLADRCREQDIPVCAGDYRQWVSSRRRIAGVIKRTLFNLRAWWQLSAKLAKFGPHVVYTGTGTTSFGAAIARRLGIPHVWHLREFGERDYGLQYDFGRNRSLRRMAQAEGLLANTQAVKSFFAPLLGRNDIQVVYNGFEFEDTADTYGYISGEEKFRDQVQNAEPVKLVILGALVAGKGQLEALQAVAELHERGLAVYLTLAGEGDPAYKKQLQSFVQEHGLEQSVEFAGFVDNPQDLYKNAAATLICSRAEGFGRTAVESLNLGTPVIGTDAGGLPEILRHGQTGLLYTPGDWRALADRIRTLLTNGELYAHVSDTGRAEVRRRFAMPRYVREIGEVLTDVVRNQADGSSDSTRLCQESHS